MRAQAINTMKANRSIEHSTMFDALCFIDQIIQILKVEKCNICIVTINDIASLVYKQISDKIHKKKFHDFFDIDKKFNCS